MKREPRRPTPNERRALEEGVGCAGWVIRGCLLVGFLWVLVAFLR